MGPASVQGVRVPQMPQRKVGRAAYAPPYEAIGRAVWAVVTQRAVNAVQRAIQSGHLPAVSGPCVDCGAPATVYDHRDYRRPMLVAPVCDGCNTRRGPAAFDAKAWAYEIRDREGTSDLVMARAAEFARELQGYADAHDFS